MNIASFNNKELLTSLFSGRTLMHYAGFELLRIAAVCQYDVKMIAATLVKAWWP
jgi:uncharacterized membrane protein YoaT (DUF817 family)